MSQVAALCVGSCIGGSSVAKILVADDNSNIQKMVILALKDQGIDVVAVGNGEAAVRKISDIRPDLVLADVFMPVRNGYEVCKYVKDDSSLAHIPVILLVGAFDPLDEQEAQRVGADGVLKKPFVPPDPLISMVKAALTRAGVVIGANAPPPPMPEAARPEPPPMPRVVPQPVYTPEPEPDPGEAARYASRPKPVNIDQGLQPLAFGSLLEATTPEDEAVFAISPKQSSTPERDWGAAEVQEEEVEEEGSKNGSWRVNSIEETLDEAPAGQIDWREAAFSGIGLEKTPADGWAPTIEKNSLAITEEEAAAIARKQNPFLPTTEQRGAEDWAKAIEAVLPEKAEPETTTFHEPVVAETAVAPPPPPPPLPASTPLSEPYTPEPPPLLNSWMAGAVSPWEAEIQKAGALASAWDTTNTAAAAVAEEASATEAFLASGTMSAPAPAEPLKTVAEPEQVQAHYSGAAPDEAIASVESLLSPETQEILHEETAQVMAEEKPASSEETATAVALPNYAEPASVPNMDEIVAKVLARMNPEVLQAVTREILKPLVEAMIKDELQKK
jgi:CheY-like chemotaxis protein